MLNFSLNKFGDNVVPGDDVSDGRQCVDRDIVIPDDDVNICVDSASVIPDSDVADGYPGDDGDHVTMESNAAGVCDGNEKNDSTLDAPQERDIE